MDSYYNMDEFKNILSFLLLLTCAHIIWATPSPPPPGRTCFALLFSDIVEKNP
jgi:hypothetical protein